MTKPPTKPPPQSAADVAPASGATAQAVGGRDAAQDGARRAERLEAALKTAGLRMTRQRNVLLQVLADADDHPDANELHDRARRIDRSVSLSTVYRTLTALEQEEVLHRHAFEGASARFEVADAPHHDHIIDVDSGDVIDFSSEQIEELQERIAKELGYEVLHHRLELYCRKLR